MSKSKAEHIHSTCEKCQPQCCYPNCEALVQPPQQKDAGVKDFVSRNITFLLKKYSDLNDDQVEEIVWKIMLEANNLETQARQQALKDALEAVGEEQHMYHCAGNNGEKCTCTYKLRNRLQAEIKANIEKLKHKV